MDMTYLISMRYIQATTNVGAYDGATIGTAIKAMIGPRA